jgi:multidrug resistance efflux pump
MKPIPSAAFVLAAAVTMAVGTRFALQDPAPAHPDAGRLNQLEQRLDALEQILFSTSQLDLRSARRRLDEARQQLEGTRELFLRGLVADAQLEQDRFAVLIAERELELAACPPDHRRLVSGLELLDSQRRLELARRNLSHTENLNRRGFASLTQIDEARAEVSLAEKAVQVSEEKAAAAEKLEAIKPSAASDDNR